MKKILPFLYFFFLLSALQAQGNYEIGLFARHTILDQDEWYTQGKSATTSWQLQFAAPLNDRFSWVMGIGIDEIFDNNYNYFIDDCFCLLPSQSSFIPLEQNNKNLELQGGIRWHWASVWRLSFTSQASISTLYRTAHKSNRNYRYTSDQSNPFLFAWHLQTGLRFTINRFLALHLNYGANQFVGQRYSSYQEQTRWYGAAGVAFTL